MAGLLRRATVGGAMAALVLCTTSGGSAEAAHARTAPPAAPGSLPNPGYVNRLNSVDALSPSNAWAVGSYCKSSCNSAPVFHNMIVHWNGTAWSTVSGPNLQNSSLGGVISLSPANAWAVGGYSHGAVVLHWNGATWSNAFTDNNIAYLASVSASSAKDVWAVGYGPNKTAALRWNGAKWSVVKTPSLGTSENLLLGVSADSANDAWAVGWYCASGCTGGTFTPRGMILHWNGTTWSRAKLPVTNSNYIFSVDAVSASNAWAVGTGTKGTLILHWNGTAWAQATVPSGSFPDAVAFSSATDGWMVGGSTFLHWDGTAWATVSTTAPSSSTFLGASADSVSDAWAVGQYCVSNCTSNNPRDDALAMHWNGTTWSRE